MNVELPASVGEALGGLLSSLAIEGFSPIALDYTPMAFGNFMVTLGNGKRTITLVRDRSQFMVRGERAAHEPAGLWRAFDNIQELEPLLLAWIRSNNLD